MHASVQECHGVKSAMVYIKVLYVSAGRNQGASLQLCRVGVQFACPLFTCFPALLGATLNSE